MNLASKDMNSALATVAGSDTSFGSSSHLKLWDVESSIQLVPHKLANVYDLEYTGTKGKASTTLSQIEPHERRW